MNPTQYLIARLKEASSYAGIVGIVLGALHVSASPDLVNAALGVVAALGGFLALLIPEKTVLPAVKTCLPLVLAASLALGLAACGSSTAINGGTATSSTSPTSTSSTSPASGSASPSSTSSSSAVTPQAVGQVATQLASTAAGQNILTWVNGLEAGAGAALQKAASNVGLTTADINNLCAWDNTAHSAIGLIELVPAIPATAASIDNAAHTAIQDACQLAANGTLPSASDLASITSEASAFASDLGISL